MGTDASSRPTRTVCERPDHLRRLKRQPPLPLYVGPELARLTQVHEPDYGLFLRQDESRVALHRWRQRIEDLKADGRLRSWRPSTIICSCAALVRDQRSSHRHQAHESPMAAHLSHISIARLLVVGNGQIPR